MKIEIELITRQTKHPSWIVSIKEIDTQIGVVLPGAFKVRHDAITLCNRMAMTYRRSGYSVEVTIPPRGK